MMAPPMRRGHFCEALRMAVSRFSGYGTPETRQRCATVRLRQREALISLFLIQMIFWAPRKLEMQLTLMRSHSDRRWSYTKDLPIDACGNLLSGSNIQTWLPYEGSIVEPLLKLDAIISTPAVVVERSLVNEVGGFDEGKLRGRLRFVASAGYA